MLCPVYCSGGARGNSARIYVVPGLHMGQRGVEAQNVVPGLPYRWGKGK